MNGSFKYWVSGGGFTVLIGFAVFYSSLATEPWTEKRIDEKLKTAPITRQAEIRIAPLEKDVKTIKQDVSHVKQSLQDVDDTLTGMKVQLGIIIRQGKN